MPSSRPSFFSRPALRQLRLLAHPVRNGDAFRRTMGFFIGPLVFLAMLLSPAPEGMNMEAWRVSAVLSLMLLWWMSEAFPLAVTALLPLVLFPLLGIADIGKTATNYGNPVVFLFMGGFVLAIAMEKWNLHMRIALGILKAVGSRANVIIAGFMGAAYFISMWISNTATVIMMMPMALSVIQLLTNQDKSGPQNPEGKRNFAVAMMLGLTYGASFGGSATLVGTPPTVVAVGYIKQAYGITLNFADWMLVTFPLCFGLLLFSWWLMTRITHPNHLGALEGAGDLVKNELAKLGRMRRGEATIAAVFGFTAFCWIFQVPLNTAFGLGLNDAGTAILGALLCFLIPVNFGQNQFLLEWKEAEKLPWGILLLFGGGMTMAGAAEASGLAEWAGQQLEKASSLSLFMVIFLAALAPKLVTEFMGNVSCISAFLPVLAALTIATNADPLMIIIPATLTASFAVMTPIGTPPNLVVFGSGHLKMADILRAGFWLNLMIMLVIPLGCYYLIPLIMH